MGLSGRLGRAGDLSCRLFQTLAAVVSPAHAQGISWASGSAGRIQIILVKPEPSVRFLSSHPLPYPQPQPPEICYFLLYPKNCKQKSFSQGNSNKGQWGHKGQKKNSLVLQPLGQQRPWRRQRDGQESFQGYRVQRQRARLEGMRVPSGCLRG